MYINKEAFSKLIETRFNGSNIECAKALEVDHSTVWRVATGNSKGGIRFLTKLMQYCNNNNLDYYEFIFLDLPLHESIRN